MIVFHGSTPVACHTTRTARDLDVDDLEVIPDDGLQPFGVRHGAVL